MLRTLVRDAWSQVAVLSWATHAFQHVPACLRDMSGRRRSRWCRSRAGGVTAGKRMAWPAQGCLRGRRPCQAVQIASWRQTPSGGLVQGRTKTAAWCGIMRGSRNDTPQAAFDDGLGGCSGTVLRDAETGQSLPLSEEAPAASSSSNSGDGRGRGVRGPPLFSSPKFFQPNMRLPRAGTWHALACH